MRSAEKPADIPHELAQRIERIFTAQGPLPAEQFLKASHLYLAEARQTGGPRRVDLDIDYFDGRPVVKALLYHPVEQRPLQPGELEKVGVAFIDTRLGLSELPSSEAIVSAVNDPIIIRIADPGLLVGRAVSEVQPDIIALGRQGSFKRVAGSPGEQDVTAPWNAPAEERVQWLTRFLAGVGPSLIPASGDDDDEGVQSATAPALIMLTAANLFDPACVYDNIPPAESRSEDGAVQ